MKATDNGGWSSKGTETLCPKCGEMGAQIETTIYGKTTITFFCNTCAHDWKEPRPINEIAAR